MYKFIAYIPETALENVKTALFNAGAGQFGQYDQCVWQTRGQGQFRPLTGANPTIGQIGTVEYVNEWRVEVIVPEDKLMAVVRAYKAAHPYEVPAYDVYRLIETETFEAITKS